MDADNYRRLESHSSRPLPVDLLLPHAHLFRASASQVISSVCERSDQCQLGDLFACISGTKSQGISYLEDAVRYGARLFLLEKPIDQLPYPQRITPNVRADFSRLCHDLAGSPSRDLKTAGITGTNGKTTTTWLLQSIWNSAGLPSGLLGTIHYDVGHSNVIPSTLTTPSSAHLASLLREMKANHLTHAALELSSHSLDQHRSDGLTLDVAAITNVTQDHLDYHSSFEHYLEAKARIASYIKPGGDLWLNETSPAYHQLRSALGIHQFDPFQIKTFGSTTHADLFAEIISVSSRETTFKVTYQNRSSVATLNLPGQHNMENALAAIGCALTTGVTLEESCLGLSSLNEVPGRLQRIDLGQSFEVFVDYAHTPDGLSRVLSTLRAQTTGRLIVVFGAGGNRDHTKRPLMGQAAAQFADLIVLTSDNPRFEDPLSIIHQIQVGIPSHTQSTVSLEPDRRLAIQQALDVARPGDVVLIAGKGHESTQTIGHRSLPFDDADVTRTLLMSNLSSSIYQIPPCDRPTSDSQQWRKTG